MAITINDNSPRAQYSASGGQTNFAGTWRIEAEADIKVYLTPVGNSPDDTTDILILTTDYTITGVGAGNSFTVILNSGATTGDFITIVADIDFATNYNFLTNQNFDPDDFNEIFSKFDRELKQLRMETRKLQPKYQNSEQVIAKDYPLPQLAENQSWRMDDVNSEIEAVVIGDTGPGEQWYGVTTGVNTFLTTITDFIGYTTGETIYLNFGSSNTAASTININGLGAKNLVNSNGIPFNSGDLVAGVTYTFLYHDNQYYLLGLGQKATLTDVQVGTNNFKYITPLLLHNHTGNTFFVDTSGAANVYIGTISGIGSYALGLTIFARISATSTGASTININGLGAKNIKRYDGTNIDSGDLVVTNIYSLVYNGTEFRIIGIQRSNQSSRGIIKIATIAETKAATDDVTAICPANAVYHPGVAKAWARFKWTGSAVQIDDSYGISSISRIGIGKYTVNFQSNFANTFFNVVGSAHSSTNSLGVTFTFPLSLTTSSASITFFSYFNGAAQDPDQYASIAFYGTK